MLRPSSLSSYYFTITGLIVSIVIGIILWVIGQSNIAAITLSIIVSILGVTLDILGRLNEQEEKIAKMFNINKLLQSDPWLFTVINEISSDYSKSLNWNSELLNTRSKSILKKCADEVHQIAEGKFHASVEEEVRLNQDMLISAKKTFKATSFVSASIWWETESTRKYLESHREIIKRGVRVDRIYIVSDMNELHECKDLIQYQLDMGINCYFVIKEGLSSGFLEDFIITDDIIMSVSHLTRGGLPKDVEVSIDPGVVLKYVEKFNALLLRAKNIKESDWNKSVDESKEQSP